MHFNFQGMGGRQSLGKRWAGWALAGEPGVQLSVAEGAEGSEPELQLQPRAARSSPGPSEGAFLLLCLGLGSTWSGSASLAAHPTAARAEQGQSPSGPGH